MAFREDARAKFPDKHNAPVPSFGPLEAELLIVGLAPGLKGANFTGRPFTGDYAGDLLYPTLLKFGYARGIFDARPDDGLELVNCRITNAVRCVPPQNKVIAEEENNCRPFLVDEIAAMTNLKAILCLGLVSHKAVLKTLGAKLSAHKFGHGAVHCLPCESRDLKAPASAGDPAKEIKVVNSYHCSRYNTNTGRLTTEMFEDVFESITASLRA